MQRIRAIIGKSFWTFSIVAVTSLAPSSGFITLTVPDEPYGAAAGIPDSPHIAKRAGDGANHLAIDAASVVYAIDAGSLAEGKLALLSSSYPHVDAALSAQIRAPPRNMPA